jgi:hypothetical protein
LERYSRCGQKIKPYAFSNLATAINMWAVSAMALLVIKCRKIFTELSLFQAFRKASDGTCLHNGDTNNCTKRSAMPFTAFYLTLSCLKGLLCCLLFEVTISGTTALRDFKDALGISDRTALNGRAISEYRTDMGASDLCGGSWKPSAGIVGAMIEIRTDHQ